MESFEKCAALYLSRRQPTFPTDYPLYDSRLSHALYTFSEPTELQLTIQYPLCISLSVHTTVDLPLAEFQPTITALYSIWRDDSRPSTALLYCTVLTNKFQLTVHYSFEGPIGFTSGQ
jgi:hypothetical protein